MSSVFPQGVKDLKISGPTNVGPKNSALRCKVILVTKFDFTAESKDELTVKKGDVLKLLDRLANGWVLVEFIDKIATPGLVPSLYVDIAVNDPINPVTLSWLHEVNTDGAQTHKNFNDIQVQMLLEKNTPFSINNKLYPLTICVTNYLMYENRFWYRVDVTYSSGEQGFLCRYYSDFYDLHVSLLDYINSIDKDTDKSTLKLPKLPEPVPSQRRNSIESSDLFSRRCRELSTYMCELISTKRFQVCPVLVDWLDVGFKELPGFVVDDVPSDSCDVINQRILPGSVILASRSSVPVMAELPKETNAASPETSKYVVPPETPKTNKPKNVYNHYQQAANYKVNIARSLSTSEGRYPTRANSKLERSKTINTATHAHKDNQLDSIANVMSPTLNRSRSVKVGPATKRASPPMATGKRYSPEMRSWARLEDSVDVVCPGHAVIFCRVGIPAKKSFFWQCYHESESPSDFSSKSVTSDVSPKSAPSDVPPKSAPSDVPQKPLQTAPPKSPLKSTAKLVRCEIKTQTNDNVVVRINVSETPNVDAFKAAVYSKFVYNNLFIKTEEGGSYEEIDSPDVDMMEIIQNSETLFLLVT
ncbi:hypothetical protein JCM33374_g1385 [Metschnikowia sp. JCM 33374]|nr:hypothetical protein JCM33374_g1385 [Metschnikowia sp. JCM 33374]